ncbi:hypothetical protein EV359DRAFT_68192 [Lentinula novae-zelandiae]|nr:hypothetical protein EV359DRAFT_68192 [Lentinula novae-zelandiae]
MIVPHRLTLPSSPPRSINDSPFLNGVTSLLQSKLLVFLEWNNLGKRFKGILEPFKGLPVSDVHRDCLRKRLGKFKWVVLAHVYNDLMEFPDEKMEIRLQSHFHSRGKKGISRREFGDALYRWLSERILNPGQTFEWPHFTPKDKPAPSIPWLQLHNIHENQCMDPLRIPGLEGCFKLLAETIKHFNWHSAHSVGHIHCFLTRPLVNDVVGDKQLKVNLNRQTLIALSFVCIDLDILPESKFGKAELINQLVKWRLTKPLKPLPRVRIASDKVLQMVQRSIRETVVPSWITHPPSDMGLQQAGTLKADHCLSPKTRDQFRSSLRDHILGLKQIFPEFMLPTHHLAFHIYNFMDGFSTVRNWWGFPFERLIAYGYNNVESDQDECDDLDGSEVAEIMEGKSNNKPPPGHKVLAAKGFYSIPSRVFGNSYVCYHQMKDFRKPWVAGQIQYIFEDEGEIKLAIRPSKPLTGHCDPFAQFVDPGFNCRAVSSQFLDCYDIVKVDLIIGHTARWEIDADFVVVLSLGRVSCSFVRIFE